MSPLTAYQTVELVCRWNALWNPIARFLLERLPGQFCETELDVNGLEKLPTLEIARVCDWLIEKVHVFSSTSTTRVMPQDAEQQVCPYGQLSLCCPSLCKCHSVLLVPRVKNDVKAVCMQPYHPKPSRTYSTFFCFETLCMPAECLPMHCLFACYRQAGTVTMLAPLQLSLLMA